MMSKCKTCGAEILWGLTESGKRVPLNPAEKRYIMADRPDQSENPVFMVDTYLSHFATCPQADQHRKKEPPVPGSTGDYLKEDQDE